MTTLVEVSNPVSINLENGLSVIYKILELASQFDVGWKEGVALENYAAGETHTTLHNWIQLRNARISLDRVTLFVDRDHYDSFLRQIATTQNASQNNMVFVRSTKTWQTAQYRLNDGEYINITFIPCEFNEGLPKRLFQFTHSAHLQDILSGIPLVAHKNLLQALTAETPYHFSMSYGLRKDEVEGYETDLYTVINTIITANAWKCWSFSDLLEQVLKQKDRDHVQAVIDKFATRTFEDTHLYEKEQKNILRACYNKIKDAGYSTESIETTLGWGE